MSLHRVSSLESWDNLIINNNNIHNNERRGSLQRITFNPVSDLIPPPAVETEILIANEVSSTKRIVQVVIACVYCLLASGIVFGYAAFKQVLVAEGVYSDRCPKNVDPPSIGQTCYEQELRLNLMFTIAAVVTNVVALPVGTILDQYGPRVSSIIGSLFIALGSCFFVFADDIPFDAYIPGYLFLALGGPFIFISAFQLSNCFPRHSGLILAMLTGAFDTSSAMFLLYRLVYQATDGTFKPSSFFTIFLAVPVFILAAQILIMPASSYKTVGEMMEYAADPMHDEAPEEQMSDPAREDFLQIQRQKRKDSVLDDMTPLLGKKKEDIIRSQDQRRKEISGVWGVLHGKSALQQIQTPWFVLITLFVVVQMTRINYFVATVKPQYEYLLGSVDRAAAVNNIFDIALPVGGVLSIPFIGLILDNLSTTTTLIILVVTATVMGILGCLPYMAAAVVNIALFVLYRPFYYTAVSDYSAKVFGFQTFGKVYGLIICISGILNFSQSGLDALRHGTFEDDPVPVNLILLALALFIGVALVFFVQKRSHKIVDHDILEQEAEDAVPTPMPDFSAGANQPSHAPRGGG